MWMPAELERGTELVTKSFLSALTGATIFGAAFALSENPDLRVVAWIVASVLLATATPDNLVLFEFLALSLQHPSHEFSLS
jgi:hypothetical protein